MMMKKTIVITVIAMILSVSSYAGGKTVINADAEVIPIPSVSINPIPLYLGLGLIASAVSKDCPCDDDARQKDMTYGGLVRAGWDINEYFGLEARALKANIEKDFSTTTHYGLYGKPQYHVNDAINVYGLLGYGRTEIEGCGFNNGTLSKNGFSYGAGFEYDLSADTSLGQYSRAFNGQGDQEKGWGLFADYQNLLANEGIFKTDTNIFTIGITYDF